MEKRHLIMGTRAKTLEDAFFLKQDQVLMEQYHLMEKMKETKEALYKISGITNQDVLQKLVDLNIPPDLAASLALVPLVEVAWADGQMDQKEKEAMLKAEGTILAKDSPDMAVLKCWMEYKPGPHLMEAWIHYIKGLCEQMTDAERKALREEVIGHARQVAQAAGGFLGLGQKISNAEQAILERFEAAFE